MIPPTLHELQELRARRQDAEAAFEQGIRDAVAAGWTHAEVAAATGLTRARVGQIAKGLAVRGPGRPKKKTDAP